MRRVVEALLERINQLESRLVHYREQEEKIFKVATLADLWHVGPSTVRQMFKNEPGVMYIPGRKHPQMRIPEEVAKRVRERLTPKK